MVLRGLLFVAAMALALCAGTNAGLAQATDDASESASDAAALRACLKANGIHPRDQYGCILSIANACIGDSEVPGTQCYRLGQERGFVAILQDRGRSCAEYFRNGCL
jgi:hypothetical protein